MLSLRLLLLLCLGGLQLLSVLLVVFSSYFSSERVLMDVARERLHAAGQMVVDNTRAFVDPALRTARVTASLLEQDVLSRTQLRALESYLFRQLQNLREASALYYGTREGDFIFVMRSPGEAGPFRSKFVLKGERGRHVQLMWRDENFNVVRQELLPQDRFDPRERQWFERAKSLGDYAWSDPYIFFSSRQPGMTLGMPVFDGTGDLKGVVGIDIEISAISRFLADLEISANGRAVIIHENGDVLAHPDPDLGVAVRDSGVLGLTKIDAFPDLLARRAFASFLTANAPEDGASDRQGPVSDFTFNGESYISVLTESLSGVLPWRVGVFAPESDFTAIIKENRAQNLWLAGLIAGLSAVIGLVLAEVLHRPVRAFAVYNAALSQDAITMRDKPTPRMYRELAKATETLRLQIIARNDAESIYGQTFNLTARAMAQLSPDAGRLRVVNKEFADLLGEKPEALYGRRLDEFIVSDEDVSFGEGMQEVQWRRADQHEISVRLNVVRIHDAQGRHTHDLLTADDISSEKSRDAQVRQLTADMSHLERVRTLGELAAGLAHELNQPLTAIAQNADIALLTLNEGAKADAELKEALLAIEDQALRAGDIIRALRTFIRADPPCKAEFDLEALAHQTLPLLRHEIEQADVLVRICAPSAIKAYGSNVQVAQVLLNLMRNGVEAMRESNAPRKLEVKITAIDQGWRIAVADTGPGVREGIQLFTQFSSSKPEGMGLGLSLCRSLVEANGGKLWYEASVSGGACFVFTLPATAAGVPAPKQKIDETVT